MKVYDCGDFYFFGRHQKYQVEAVLEDELGLAVTAQEITWEEYERQIVANEGERMNDELDT